jgi:hypothetical protein
MTNFLSRIGDVGRGNFFWKILLLTFRVMKMDRVVFVAENHREAEEHDIRQNREKTPDERIAAFIELRHRLYGEDLIDIKEYERSFKD